jgi:hypothetical protein
LQLSLTTTGTLMEAPAVAAMKLLAMMLPFMMVRNGLPSLAGRLHLGSSAVTCCLPQ